MIPQFVPLAWVGDTRQLVPQQEISLNSTNQGVIPQPVSQRGERRWVYKEEKNVTPFLDIPTMDRVQWWYLIWDHDLNVFFRKLIK